MRIRLLLAAGLLALTLGIAPLALATESTDEDTSTSSSEKDEASLNKRIEALKKKLRITLKESEKTRLKARCLPAQALVKKVHTRFGNKVVTRTQAYSELSKVLDKLVEKLKAKEANTTTLESYIAVLKTKIAVYETDLADYKQKLSDLKDMDCKADPEAFKAALEAARTARDKLIQDITAVRTYVKETIKLELLTIRKSLETQDTEETTTNQ